MPAPVHPLHTQLATQLLTRHSLPVSPAWLNDFLSTRGATPPPLPALLSTAHFRILATDITSSLAPSSIHDVLPVDIADVNVKERRLQGSVVVQVLDVVDVGASKWSHIEAIERVERGEEIRGREVIRSVAGVMADEDGGTTAATGGGGSNAQSTISGVAKLSAGPHKLVVQDAHGTNVLAFELVKIPKIALSAAASAVLPPPPPSSATTSTAIATTSTSGQNQPQNGMHHQLDDPGMYIGCKLLLKPGTLVRRGIVMLTPDTCVVMGGKVETWDRTWKKDRKARLGRLIADQHEQGQRQEQGQGQGGE